MRFDPADQSPLLALTAVTALLIAVAGASPAALAQKERTVLMVLDASGSMVQKLPDGATRMDAAKAAVVDALGKVADTQRIGLRVYGHQSPTSAKNCEDSALVTPLGPAGNARAAITSAIAPLAAKGYTPIRFSLERAAGDLASEAGKEKVIVLISDGKETCAGDPCAMAKALAKADADLVIHTIGFAVDQAARQQLQCIAAVGRGTYFDAQNRNDLGDKLGTAARQVKAEPPKEGGDFGNIVLKGLTSTGQEAEVRNAETGVSVQSDGWMANSGARVPPGIYDLKLMNGLWRGVLVRSGQTTELRPAQLVFQGGNLTHNGLFKILDAETGEVTGDATIDAFERHALMPGRFRIQLDDFSPMEPLDFDSEKITTVPVGQLAVKLGTADQYHMIEVKAEDGGFGIIVGRPKTLPPGRYVVRDTNDDSRPKVAVEIKAGQITTMQFPQ
jgi:hypothetical protein